METIDESSEFILSHPAELAVNERVRLRLSTPGDADTLETWMAEPAVANWWSNGMPVSREEIEAKYTGARLPRVACYIIESDGQPAGFIQAWQKADDKRGLDMFVSATAQGQGIGPQVARALAEDLTSRGWEEITVDPTADNKNAIHAWEKAGFVATGEIDDSDDYKTQIMVFRPTKP